MLHSPASLTRPVARLDLVGDLPRRVRRHRAGQPRVDPGFASEGKRRVKSGSKSAPRVVTTAHLESLDFLYVALDLQGFRSGSMSDAFKR